MNEWILVASASDSLIRGVIREALSNPLIWAVACGALAIGLMLPRSTRRRRPWGMLLGFVSFGCLMGALPFLDEIAAHLIFWALGLVTIGSATATISVRSPVYAAIWFALSLLGTAGLFLFLGAQFLGVATIVVYAGAIVVMFLFVIMLAQPEGDAPYDRINWSDFSKPFAVLTAATLVGVTTFTIVKLPTVIQSAKSSPGLLPLKTLADAHMAMLGSELFGRHLVSVEVAGTLLLVALVGAIAIVMQQREVRSLEDRGRG